MEAAVKIKPVGDRAVLVELGNKIDEAVNRKVMALAGVVSEKSVPGMLETVPAFASLMIYYDFMRTDFINVAQRVERLAQNLDDRSEQIGRIVEIPVCYGGAFGEDLSFVAQHAGLSEQEVVKIHSGRDYRIFMLGFLPGFPYLGGMDERIFTPRLSSPRTKIPAGSVGIGGEQTGIYPMDSPGGWQLIGRTPLKLYDPEQDGGIRYEAGDIIRFVPVGEAEYQEIFQKEMR